MTHPLAPGDGAEPALREHIEDWNAEPARIADIYERAPAPRKRDVLFLVERVQVYRAALQRVMQVLGPSVPDDVDYTQPDNAAGLMAEQSSALAILRELGITFKPRKDEAV